MTPKAVIPEAGTPDVSSGLARRDVDHLIEIIHMVNSHQDEVQLIHAVLDRLVQIGVASVVVTRRLNVDKTELEPVATPEQVNSPNPLVSTLAQVVVPIEGSFEGYALDQGEMLVVTRETGGPPIEIDEEYMAQVLLAAEQGATGGYFFPMIGAQPIGVVTFYSGEDAGFDLRRQQLVASAVRVLSFGIDKCRMLRDAKTQQDDLRRMSARLAASNRDLQDFAYVASHDLQEPLRKIQAFGDRLETMAADRLDEDQLHNLERMQASSKKMQALIQDLLRFSRINTCKLNVERVDMRSLVSAALDTLRIATDDVELELVGDLEICIDRALGEQLFTNLIENALKYRSPSRSLRLIIGGESTDGATNIKISDNGIGFEQSYEKRIFDPFFRLHNESEISGSGIGLALCRRIAERHSGNIEATGSEGIGATFSISLPLGSARREGTQETPAI